MRWPYHFVDLSKDQLRDRRTLLDSYGQLAQLSVLLLPLFCQLFLGIKLLAKRSKPKRGYEPLKEHQSPISSELHTRERRRLATSPGTTWKRISWWLDEPIAAGWETRWQCLLAVLWTFWLLFLAMKGTGDDYLHMAKRFGIVAASQLPIHYLLTAKAWSPVQFLARLSHEQLNPYHRLLGRVIVFFFACHALLYLNFFVQKGLLSKRIRDWDVILGLTAMSSATILFTTALAKLRNYSYRLFFYTHVLLASLLLPILYLHVSHLRIYVLETAAIFIVIIIQRNLAQTTLSATITRFSHTNILSITIPLPERNQLRNFTPGQHIYLGSPSPIKKLVKNPFTIANIPSPSANHIQLVVRALSGPTATLNELADSKQPVPVTIEGPYGSAGKLPRLQGFDRVLLIAGGVGATFTVPIYRALRGVMGKGRVRFVWAVRRLEDAEWAAREGEEGLGDYVELYITGTRACDTGNTSVSLARKNAVVADDDDGFELQDVGGTSAGGKGGLGATTVMDGRPDLRAIVDWTFEHDPDERVAVLVCGPGGMGAALKKEVGRWVTQERDVYWHNEEFGW